MSGGLWLDNWRGLRNSAILGGGSGSYISDLTRAYDINGRTVYAQSGRMPSPIAGIYNSISVGAEGITVRFGQSDTAPTAADYNLGDPVTENLTYVSASTVSQTRSGATVSRTYTVTIQNKAAAPVVFREYGLFVQGQYLSGTTNYSTTVMIYREVLDTPVTLAQYETATITFTVSLTLGDPVPGVTP